VTKTGEMSRRNEKGDSSITPTSSLHTCVSENHSHCTLNTKGQIGDKSCLVIIHTGASLTTARLDITVGLLERYLSMLYVLQMALGDPPHPEQSVSKVDFGAVLADGLGVHRQYHRQVLPGTGCLVYP
jgi:hypothetical protein